MKKITINNIIKFRNKAAKSQKGFLNGLKRKEDVKSDGGGNYWIRSLSALSNSIKLNDHEPIKDKIGEVLELFSPELTKQTKDMYERNLNILHNYEDFDFFNWLPSQYEILSKTNKKTIVEINTVPVQITPSQVFCFSENGVNYVGAIWFVAKLDGYKKEELAMFTEALFIFLITNFENKYTISKKHCIVVDVLDKVDISYEQIINKDISSPLKSVLNLISKQV